MSFPLIDIKSRKSFLAAESLPTRPSIRGKSFYLTLEDLANIPSASAEPHGLSGAADGAAVTATSGGSVAASVAAAVVAAAGGSVAASVAAVVVAVTGGSVLASVAVFR